MRIWDLPPALLCRQHLLGEHRELHGLWNILVANKRGYSNHPETRRWVGRLAALRVRHEALVEEMSRRGYRHASPLPMDGATGDALQRTYIDSPARQLALLTAKSCACPLLDAAGTPCKPVAAATGAKSWSHGRMPVMFAVNSTADEGEGEA